MPRLTARQTSLPLLLLYLGLQGCTTVRVDMPASATPPPSFAEAPTSAPTAQDRQQSLEALTHWWQGVADPTLQQLIEEGLKANADIRLAVARVKEARTVVTMAESALYPTLEAYGFTGRQKVSDVSPPSLPAGLPVSVPAVNVPISSFNGSGFAAAWEVDVFGARRSDADAARQAALAYEEKLHGAQMMVAGDIASNYIEARSIAYRQAVLTESIATVERLQRYAKGRFDAGQATRYDVDRVQVQIDSLKAMQAPLRSLLDARLRRLAVLTGKQPQALKALPSPNAQAPADASVIPAKLPTVLPSDVLERRPDVRGSANLVRAMAARLGSAKAEVLPKFYLGFLSNDGRLEIGSLPSASSGFTAWGAGVRLPIFEGGRIAANIKASDARLEAAAAQYEQAVMSALEDVENAYSARLALDQRAQQLTQAWQTAADGANHADKLFTEGSTLLQPALEARLSALQRQDELIQAQTARALTTVLLYKAIGGGWSSDAAAN